MSTYYLVNRIKVGTRIFSPGAFIDDANEDAAAIQAAGGLLVASSDTTVATAAALAIQLSARGQHLEAAFIMLAAATKSSSGDDVVTNLASVAAGKGTALVGDEDAAGRFAGATAGAQLQEIGGRILGAFADEAAIKAVPATARANGQIAVDLTNDVLWTFDSGSSAGASSWVLVPDAGTGRWLRKHVSLADMAVAFQAVAAGAMASGTLTINTGITVATSSEVIPLLRGAVTGSTNFGSLRELVSSRVNGAPGVGTVVIQAVGADGNIDADAAVGAGLIHVVIFTPIP